MEWETVGCRMKEKKALEFIRTHARTHSRVESVIVTPLFGVSARRRRRRRRRDGLWALDAGRWDSEIATGNGISIATNWNATFQFLEWLHSEREGGRETIESERDSITAVLRTSSSLANAGSAGGVVFPGPPPLFFHLSNTNFFLSFQLLRAAVCSFDWKENSSHLMDWWRNRQVTRRRRRRRRQLLIILS